MHCLFSFNLHFNSCSGLVLLNVEWSEKQNIQQKSYQCFHWIYNRLNSILSLQFTLLPTLCLKLLHFLTHQQSFYHINTSCHLTCWSYLFWINQLWNRVVQTTAHVSLTQHMRSFQSARTRTQCKRQLSCQCCCRGMHEYKKWCLDCSSNGFDLS